MARRPLLFSLALAVTLTAGAATGVASAATPTDLHTVSFANRTIPGSTCFADHAITLHNGQGQGGQRYGYQLVVNIGSARYGDITHDGRDEAFVLANCSTGGGTAASGVKNSYVVFTGTDTGARVLGVLTAAHRWIGTQAALLG